MYLSVQSFAGTETCKIVELNVSCSPGDLPNTADFCSLLKKSIYTTGNHNDFVSVTCPVSLQCTKAFFGIRDN